MIAQGAATEKKMWAAVAPSSGDAWAAGKIILFEKGRNKGMVGGEVLP
jgi:hypothetical protein